MDPLTHALTGAALANALPVPELKRRSLLFAMVMSAAPDVDVLPAFVAGLPGNLVPSALLFDPYWMHLHRGVTHSLLFAVGFGLVAGWCFWRIGIRKGSVWKWPAFTVLVLLSHVLLDLLNAGVMLWAPFSDEWVRFADLPVVDPFRLAPLLICFFAAVPPSMLWRRKGREGPLEQAWRCLNETAEQRYGKRNVARFCLLFAGAIIALRCAVAVRHEKAVSHNFGTGQNHAGQTTVLLPRNAGLAEDIHTAELPSQGGRAVCHPSTPDAGNGACDNGCGGKHRVLCFCPVRDPAQPV